MKIFKAEPLLHYQFYRTRRSILDRIIFRDEHKKSGFNCRMFEEDFSRLFHYADRNRRELFKIASNDEDLTKRMLSNIQSRYENNSLDENIRDLVVNIAESLIGFGKCHYFLRDVAESDEIQVIWLASSGLLNFLGSSIQWVPEREKKHSDRDERLPREVRILDFTKVMSFSLPKSTKRMLSAQKRIFKVIDRYQFDVTDFQPQPTHENPNPTTYFDFGVWREMLDRALYRSTRATGWVGRKYDSPNRSEFFDCQRLIRFRRNQLRLRDSIMAQLSAELSRVGRSYNSEYTVLLSPADALPSVVHLDELESRLMREEVGFTEIFDYCFKH